MKKILKMFCLILIFTMIFPVVIQASEDNHQTGNLFGGEQEKFEKLVGESQEIKRAHPGDAEKEIKIIMDNQPLGIERGIMDIWNVLTDSEKTLYIRYPFDALKANKEKNIAKTKTEAKFGLNSLGDKSDASRILLCLYRQNSSSLFSGLASLSVLLFEYHHHKSLYLAFPSSLFYSLTACPFPFSRFSLVFLMVCIIDHIISLS